KHVPAHKSTTAKEKKLNHPPDKERTSARRRGGARGVTEAIPLPRERPTNPPEATEPAVAALPPDVAAAKQAIGLVRQGKSSEASALAKSIGDPVAQTLVEWVLLRSADSAAGFERYAAFIRANPHWPSIPLLRRRAEVRLWQERRDAASVRRFLDGQPTTAMGRFALARVLMKEGD